MRWLRPPRRLRFTREGWYFFFISLGVGLAAINTGNNLLYLILGMTLSLIIVSGILSEITLRQLDVVRHQPHAIYCGKPFLVGIAVTNQKKKYPSFSVEVEDLIDGKPIEKKCYFLKVPANRTQQTSYRFALARRGVYRLSGFRISTKFPFALFRKSRLVECPTELLVFPSLVDVTTLLRVEHPSVGDSTRARVGHGDDYHSLREFQAGDDSREIHWKATAKAARLLVREREDEAARRVAICLFSLDVGEETPAYDNERERAISVAASIAVQMITQGFQVALTTLSGSVPLATGTRQTTRILRELAQLRFDRSDAHGWQIPKGGGIDRIAVVHRRAASRLPARRSFSKVIEVGDA